MPLSNAPWSNDAAAANEINAWIVIDPDETITIRIPHAEMGQGAGTANPMLVAEELECDWAKIKGEFASPNRNVRENNVYKDQNTVGSRGVATSWQYLQQAGASARARLVQAAANQWNVPAAECVAENGAVLHKASNRRLTYGKLAPDAAKITLDKEPAIKTPDQFKLVGKPLPRLDTPVKVNGAAKFGIDTRIEGMTYAAIISCPVVGGTVASVDESPIAGKRGIVKVVRLDECGRRRRRQHLARAGSAERAEDHLELRRRRQRRYRADEEVLSRRVERSRSSMSARTATPRARLRKATKVIEATYEVPHLAHVPMEPLNATVKLAADRLDVWMGTQSAVATLKLAAADVGSEARAMLHPQRLSRRRLRPAFAQRRDAPGDPGREGRRPAGQAHLGSSAGHARRPLSSAGGGPLHARRSVPTARSTALETRFAVGSINRSIGRPLENGMEGQAHDGLSNQGYKIPNFHVAGILKNTHLPVSFWRSVGGSQNCFFFESFIDELAFAAGKDPLEFRRAMLDRKDFLTVLNKLEEVSNWKQKLPAGRGRGIAITFNHGSVVGHVAEVTVDNQNRVRVDRVLVAVDCYNVVNPKIIEAQMESGAIYGLTAALYGDITVKEGQIQELNFDTQRNVQMSEAPQDRGLSHADRRHDAERRAEMGRHRRMRHRADRARAHQCDLRRDRQSACANLPLKNVKLAEIASL